MKELCLIFLMIATIILTVSIIGMFLFVPDDFNDKPSTWMQIGKNLVNDIINK